MSIITKRNSQTSNNSILLQAIKCQNDNITVQKLIDPTHHKRTHAGTQKRRASISLQNYAHSRFIGARHEYVEPTGCLLSLLSLVSMDGTKVGILEQRHKVSLSRFLKRENSSRLEAEVIFEVLSNFANESLKRQFSEEKVRAFLILANLTQSNRSRSEPVRLLHAPCRRCGLASCLGCKLFARCLPTGTLSGCLFSSSHHE